MLLSVVMPVYNEKNTIEEIIRRVHNVNIEKELIIVDDLSTDGTREILKEMESKSPKNMRFVYHENNRGKGAALRTGFHEAAGDIVIVQDADLEVDPNEYPRLVAPIQAGLADVVYGSRFLGYPHSVIPYRNYLANKFLTQFSNFVNNITLTDMETCYKVFRREIIQGVKLVSDRFGFEPEVTAKIAKKKCRIYEIPITYNVRYADEGKKINWKDGLAAIWHIIRFRLAD